MPSVSIQSNIAKLNMAMQMYIRANSRGVAFAMQKQSRELGINLSKAAKGLIPEKGAITDSRIAALKEGEGVKISNTVRREIAEKYHLAQDFERVTYMVRGKKRQRAVRSILVNGKRLNLQALMVKRELALRESGRGFLRHADKFAIQSAGDISQQRRIETTTSRYGPQLGQFAFVVGESDGSAVFTWGGFSELSDEAVKAMGRSKGQAAIVAAIGATIDNMVPYISSHLGESEEAVRNLVK